MLYGATSTPHELHEHVLSTMPSFLFFKIKFEIKYPANHNTFSLKYRNLLNCAKMLTPPTSNSPLLQQAAIVHHCDN